MENNLKLALTVSDDDSGLRLDKFLTGLDEVSSRNYAQTLIEKNFVLVNGKPAKPSLQLKPGQKIEISLPPVESTELVPYKLSLDIIFEDSDLLVVNKPAGLVVHPAAGHQQDTLVNALLNHTKDLSMKNEQRPGIVHRIDKDTSGLLVVAKNDFAHDLLAAQFKNKTTHRLYYAVADGAFKKPAGVVQSYLARHPSDRKRYASIRENNKIISSQNEKILGGKWAVTHYRCLAQAGGYSYVQLKLETGRTHQIRVHMSELGHPLLGDTVYGFSKAKTHELSVERFFLHAAELGFIHPKSKENLIFKVNWPQKDLHFIQNIGFQNAVISK